MKADFLSGFSRALVAGLVAGLAMTAAAVFLTLPLIAMGEQVEAQLATAPNLLALPRFSGTIVANLATSVSLALWLLAIVFMFNLSITFKNAFAWVLCFWLAVFFIPALSMPPTLPGMAAGHHDHDTLSLRQLLWLGVVLSAGVGFLLHTEFFKKRLAHNLRIILSLLLLTLPTLLAMLLLPLHPAPSAMPPALAQLFVMRSLLTGLILSASMIMVFAITFKK